ncbi:hypothetical protein MMC25_002566 [Agyrium rufum]|nr:hypothetical protein [Agyrium rufum]
MTTQSQESLRGPGVTYLRPELQSPDFKIIAVEEHAGFPDLLSRVSKDNHAYKVFSSMMSQMAKSYVGPRITDVGMQRIKDMDEGGIGVQVLSLAGIVNTTHASDAQAGIEMARDLNNALKAVVDANPKRFRAFAELPLLTPQEAVNELHRCVKDLGFVGAMVSGSIGSHGKFLDSPEFDAVLSAFEELDVPLYLHPGIPPQGVWDAYYDIPGNPQLSTSFATSGWGWHNEVAIHVVRLAVTGTLDKHPKLKIIVGHQGEMIPMMLQRFDRTFNHQVHGFQRSVGEMLRSQVWIAISGMFSLPPTQAAISAWGIDKVIFANDYPFVPAQEVPSYVKSLGDILAPADLKKICQTNAEELLRFRA